MARPKVTLDEKKAVRDFIQGLAATHPGGWDGLLRDAGVPYNTGQGWRYENPRTMPSTLHLLRILDAAGVLRAAAARSLNEAVQALDDYAIPLAGRRARAGRGRRASNG